MAYTFDQDDEEQERLAGQPLAVPSMGPGAAAGPAPAASGPQPGQGSGFVGWDQILNANKDAATGQANQLAGKVGAAGQAAKTGLAGAQKDFTHAANSRMPGGANVNYAVAPGTVATQKPAAAAPALPGSIPPAPAPGKSAKPTGSVATTTAPNGETMHSKKAPAPSPLAPVSAVKPAQSPLGPTAQPAISDTGGEGTISPSEAARLAAEKYTGPQSLSDVDGYDSLLTGAKEAKSQTQALQQRDEMGNLRGEAGIEALMNPGKQSTGNSRLDAALVGATGRKRFQDLDAQYGGLLKEYDSAQKSSIADAGNRTAQVARGAQAAQGQLNQWNAGQADRAKAETDRLAAEKAKKDQHDLDRTGKASWEDYNTGHEFENTMKDIGRWSNPLSWIAGLVDSAGGGMKSIDDLVVPGVEKWANENVGSQLNSSRVRWNTVPLPEPAKRAIFDSMTTTELTALEKMSPHDQQMWILKRYEEMQGKAQTTLGKKAD